MNRKIRKKFWVLKNGTIQGEVVAKSKTDAEGIVIAKYGEEREVVEALRSIRDIALDITREWRNPSEMAEGLLDHMIEMDDESDSEKISLFLGNCLTFRNGKAKALKEELKNHLNQIV